MCLQGADSNNDGVLCKKEWIALHGDTTTFHIADVDGDGLITQEENDKYLQITKDQLRSSLLKTSDVNVGHVRDPLDEMFKQSSPEGEESSSSDEDSSEVPHTPVPD